MMTKRLLEDAKVGDRVKRRDGKLATIIDVGGESTWYPISYLVDGAPEDQTRTVSYSGGFDLNPALEHRADIVELLPAIEGGSSEPNLIPPGFFADVRPVMEFGAKKHGTANWLKKDGKKSSPQEMYESINRHLIAALKGEKEDHETGLHPLAHAMARVAMWLHRDKNGLNNAD